MLLLVKGTPMISSSLLCRTALRRKYGLPQACPLLPEGADDCCVHLCCGAAAARQVPAASAVCVECRLRIFA